jgi:hypothetical protein
MCGLRVAYKHNVAAVALIDRELEQISRYPRRLEVWNDATDHLAHLISAFLGDSQNLDLLCEISAFVSDHSDDLDPVVFVDSSFCDNLLEQFAAANLVTHDFVMALIESVTVFPGVCRCLLDGGIVNLCAVHLENQTNVRRVDQILSIITHLLPTYCEADDILMLPWEAIRSVSSGLGILKVLIQAIHDGSDDDVITFIPTAVDIFSDLIDDIDANDDVASRIFWFLYLVVRRSPSDDVRLMDEQLLFARSFRYFDSENNDILYPFMGFVICVLERSQRPVRARLFETFPPADLFQLVLDRPANHDITRVGLACIHQCLENDDCSPGDLEEVRPEMLIRRMKKGSFKIKGRCLFIILLLLKNQMPITEQLFNLGVIEVAADLVRTFPFQVLCLAHICAKVLRAMGRGGEALEQIDSVELLQEAESLLESDPEQAEEIQRMIEIIQSMMEEASQASFQQ